MTVGKFVTPQSDRTWLSRRLIAPSRSVLERVLSNTKATGLAFSSWLLLSANITQAAVADVSPYSEIDRLAPEEHHPLVVQQVMSTLLRSHYERKRLDDQLSSSVLDTLLDDVDGTRSYFLASDIASFERYRLQLDNALSQGDLKPAFEIYNRYQKRLSERLSFLLEELANPAKKYVFDKNDALELDREDVPWAKTLAELDELWRKRLKNSILNLKLAGKEVDDSIDLLKRRYQTQLNRIHQAKSEDAFQFYMGAVTRTFDPHTQYLSPRNSENFNINMSLSLQGIGAVLQTEDEHTKVVRLVPGGPASEAGNLKPTDRILGVGQGETGEIVDVVGWRLDEVVDLIRGPKKTTVRLQIAANESNEDVSKVIAIVRDEVKLEEQSAQSEILEFEVPVTSIDGKLNVQKRRFGVIDIPTFYTDFKGRMEKRPDYRSTTRDVQRLINELSQQNIDGLIIDLRNNGGGSLDEAINLTGLFIPTGPVVQVRSARGRIEILQDRDPMTAYNGPLLVMVNRLSASASEIFAGAIQDYGRGLVVGGQTFGKGTVQSLRPLSKGQLKITQAKFYRVSGESTQHQGVIPDILFPTLFDKDKIGESSLEAALPWDTVKAAQYQSSANIRPSLMDLRSRHSARIKANPDFLFLKEQKTIANELRQQTLISLNEATRRQERETNQQRRLALENDRRSAKNLPQLESWSEVEADIEADDVDTADPEIEEEQDALLVEAGNILSDFIGYFAAKGQPSVAAK